MAEERIEVDQFVPHPRERVWRALTDPARMARWLMPNDFRLEAGHRFTLTTTPVPRTGFDGVVHCRVLGFTAPEVLRIGWRAGGVDTEVTWRLVREGTGTRVLLVHSGFDTADESQQAVRRLLGGGWRSRILPALAAAVAPDQAG
ncbi:uncharacterized protein YndB with AHSA1/START domain [Stackebrandtia albiflava]|uniref:Uncharacterized protein YndB with AHSA1/START domain n=1 Tax=Stackebrandtia albiflava TaxID=406432 RepID=A0A562URP9_9ACTN|nr:SRPBCC domain-containing protein [Stackebrandtia albiflava]TWJ08290.1 uncharacterized protein YndB with AHSA1/START domain [Stackebrandtia albiflava]